MDPLIYPLHDAAAKNKMSIAKRLLAEGHNVNMGCSGDNQPAMRLGCTPLHAAAGRGHLDMVKLLVENGAEVNQQSQLGYSALRWSCQEGHADVVRYLLGIGDADRG